MGLSCLLGHDFGHPTHEQERERRGEEVILTTRDVKTCRRCGTERVLTENIAVMNDGAPASAESKKSDAEAASETVEANGDEPPAAGTALPPQTQASASEEDTATPTAESEELGANGTANDRESAEAAAITTGKTTSEGTKEEPKITDDAVILTDDDPDERRPMEWPDSGNGETRSERTAATNGTEGPPKTALGGDASSEFRRENDQKVLCCENCAATWKLNSSSLIRGDPCPLCRSTYVTGRTK